MFFREQYFNCLADLIVLRARTNICAYFYTEKRAYVVLIWPFAFQQCVFLFHPSLASWALTFSGIFEYLSSMSHVAPA